MSAPLIWVGLLVLGLAAGGFMGFSLGVEYAPKCLEMTSAAPGAYKSGLRDGRADGAADFARTLRARAVEAKNTWTITKAELDRLEEEMTEYDPE